jgi:hypothetical protein
MTMDQLMERACRLEQQIRNAVDADRMALQPEFNRILNRIKDAGGVIPGHLRRTEQVLRDELVETQFDNMPV